MPVDQGELEPGHAHGSLQLGDRRQGARGRSPGLHRSCTGRLRWGGGLLTLSQRSARTHPVRRRASAPRLRTSVGKRGRVVAVQGEERRSGDERASYGGKRAGDRDARSGLGVGQAFERGGRSGRGQEGSGVVGLEHVVALCPAAQQRGDVDRLHRTASAAVDQCLAVQRIEQAGDVSGAEVGGRGDLTHAVGRPHVGEQPDQPASLGSAEARLAARRWRGVALGSDGLQVERRIVELEASVAGQIEVVDVLGG